MTVNEMYSKVSFIKPKQLAKLTIPLFVLIAIYALDAFTENVYPEGYVEIYYPVFLLIAIIVYLIFAVLSCWFPKIRKKTLHYCWMLSAFFVLTGFLTFVTLKTGNARLPFVPSPDQIIGATIENGNAVFENFLGSLSLLLQGLAVGGIAGFFYGTLMGYSKFFNYWLSPFVKLIGPVPAVAWTAIMMVAAPTTHIASVSLVALTMWFPLSINLSAGIQGVEKKYVERAQILGASHFYILRHVIYPAALPNLFTGLFMGVCFSLTSLVMSAELIGVKAGLGWYIVNAEQWASYDQIFGALIIFIIMAFLMISILFKIQKHVMKWQKGAIQW